MFNVVLLGDPRVGKSTIVNHFLEKGRTIKVDKANKKVNMVEMQFPSGLTKKVIFTEIQTMELTESNKDIELDQKYDLICICFEHSNYLKKFMQEKQLYLRHLVPKLGVYCKNDNRLFDKKLTEQKEFSDEFGLKLFAECSNKQGKFTSLSSSILKVLENPELGLKESEILELSGSSKVELLSKWSLPITGGILLSVLVLYGIKKYAQK